MNFNLEAIKKMSLFKKIVFGAVAGILVLFAFSIGIVSCAEKNKVTVGFYDLPSSEIAIFKTACSKVKYNNKSLKLKFVELDKENLLSDELKNNPKIDLLISFDGLSISSLKTKRNAYLENSLSENKTISGELISSIRTAGILSKSGKIKKLPLLLDNLEFTIDRSVMSETNTKTISNWANIETFCEKSKEVVSNPIIFAGNDELFMLDFVGAICEAVSGKENYSKAVKLISETFATASKKNTPVNYISLSKELCEKKGPLAHSIAFLNKFYSSEYFSRDCFAFSENTVHLTMDANQAAVAVQYLSSHRKAKLETLKRYSSSYIISNFSAEERRFTSPLICAVPLSKNKKAKILARDLISADTQVFLSNATGLAPVLAGCEAPDIEADDVRYWVAATNTPLNGLSRDAFLSKKAARELEKMIVGYIVK